MNHSYRFTMCVAIVAMSVAFGTCKDANANWWKKAGHNVSQGWKNTAGRSWNRTIRDPWYKKVYRPTVVDPYNRANAGLERARRRYQENWNRRIEEWNAKVRRQRQSVTRYVRQNANRLGLKNERAINREIARRMQSFIQRKPYPERR